MLKIILKYKSCVLVLCLAVSVIFAAYGFRRDIRNTTQYMMNDFRSRVVAARLLNDGIDPYFYKWSQGEPEAYLDARDFPSRPMSRVTVPPTTLLINKLMLKLDYPVQKTIWLVLQWIALLLCIGFLSAGVKNKTTKSIIWIFGLAFFAGGWYFRFHVDAGQLYILFIMLLTASYFILNRNKNKDSFVAGLLIGFTASLRPNAVLFCIPLLIAKKLKTIAGAFIGCVANIGLAVSVWGITPWINYLKVLKYHENVHLGIMKVDRIQNWMVYNIKEVEGVRSFDLTNRFLFTDSSFQDLFNLNSLSLISILAVILIVLSVFLFINRKKLVSIELIALTGILAVIISEFFIPAARYSYYDVIWLLPFGLIAKMVDKNPQINQIINLSFYACGVIALFVGGHILVLSLLAPIVLLIITIWLSAMLIKYTIPPVEPRDILS